MSEIEWTNLRQEIFELDKACLNILQYSIALTSGIILLLTKTDNVTIKVDANAVWILISIIWTLFYMYVHHKRLRISTIGGYLRKFVEKDIHPSSTPLWLTCLGEFRKKRYSRTDYLLSAIKPSWVEFLSDNKSIFSLSKKSDFFWII